MKIVFMGTPDFALPSLRILLENKYDIVAVVTVPDKPAGRGLKTTASSVKTFAAGMNLPLLQPERLNDSGFIAELQKLGADLFVVVAFRILPPEVFKLPRYGSFNLHASLLPKYRGAAPINWAIIRGEKETGVTTFFLREKVDTGDIILQNSMAIGPEETAGELHDKLADAGAELVLRSVRLIESGEVKSLKQKEALSSPAPKIRREDCIIKWSMSASEVHNFVRGLSPKPTAFTTHGKTILKIYRTKISDLTENHADGVILKAGHGLRVATGKGSVEILEIQQEGRKKMNGEEFLRGYSIREGERLS